MLFIGNSFSEDTITRLNCPFKDLGITLLGVNACIAGCSIDKHYNYLRNNTAEYVKQVYDDPSQGCFVQTTKNVLADIIESEDWDFVSVQQVSDDSGMPSSYGNLYNLVNEIKTHLQDVNHTRFIFHMTWAYSCDSTHPAFLNYHNDQMEMYNAIVGCAQALDRNVFDIIIPNGTAVQNARTSYLGDTLNKDGFHLNTEYGRYMASVSACMALTGADISKCTSRFTGLSAYQAETVIESAMDAFENPFEITESRHKSADPH